MSRAFFQSAWGLLLIFFDIRIGLLDILPDIVGFILLLFGLDMLRRREQLFSSGYTAACLFAVLSLIHFVAAMTYHPEPAQEMVLASRPPLLLGIEVLSIMLSTVMIYSFCRGIEVLAADDRETALKNSARKRRQIFIVLQVIWLVGLPFGFNVPASTFVPVFFTLSLVTLISSLSIILLARTAGRRLSDRRAAAYKLN